ncbi:MAG: TonB-dependent receptor plug domain-containing protein, partial [Acidobacteria bacterium]|nr:TonB-dependent receptor plug domain-containing protein [Acidobacteriota bacterium]
MKNRSLPSTSASVAVRPRRRGRARIFVLGSAVVASGVSMPPASAAAGSQDVPQAAVADSEKAIVVDIAPGPLADVLAAFQRATGIEVTLTEAALGSLPSPGVRGTMSARQAMAALLTGTPVQAGFGAEGVQLGVTTGVSETVRVSGRAPAAVSSPRYTVPLRDIAQTVALVPRAVLEQQGAATLTDALRNVPGITLQAGEGGGSSSTAGDMFNMRGFSANNSLFVDNVRDSGLIARDVFNVEQVEVFMGPAGSDVGRGTAAGYVNMPTKRPHQGTEYSVNAAGGSAGQARVTADFNWSVPAGPESGWLSHSAVRLNALWQDRGVPGRDEVKNESRAVAPSVALGIGTPTRVIASAQLVRQDNLPDYGMPTAAWTDDLLAPTVVQTVQPVRQANYYGSPAYDFDEARQTSYLARVERDVTRNLTIANQSRVNRTHRAAVVSAITGVASYVPATELVTVARQGNERENTIASNQTTVVSRFTTGRLRHGLSGGVEVVRENQFAPSMVGLGTRAPVNIFAPNPK